MKSFFAKTIARRIAGTVLALIIAASASTAHAKTNGGHTVYFYGRYYGVGLSGVELIITDTVQMEGTPFCPPAFVFTKGPNAGVWVLNPIGGCERLIVDGMQFLP